MQDCSADLTAAKDDATAAALVRTAAQSLASKQTWTPSDEALRLVQAAFRASSEHPNWTLTPVAASAAFETLVRTPRILSAYKHGTPTALIQERFGIAKTSLYALLEECDLQTDRESGRPRVTSHAAVRLDAAHGYTKPEIARRRNCSVRTVQRIVNKPTSATQPYIDRLGIAPTGEPLRGAWNRLLDALTELGPAIASQPEPDWPTDQARAALAASAIAYYRHIHELSEPPWLSSSRLIAPEPVSPTPQFAHIAKAFTPAVVARFNVICDKDSFHSV